MSFQKEKAVIAELYSALDSAKPDHLSNVTSRFYAQDLSWFGVHPFNELYNSDSVASVFWQPLKTSFTGLQRRMDVFYAGQNMYDDPGGVWVTSMGHYMGLFDKPWLGIRPTHKLVMIRYSSFHRVENGKIVHEAMFVDIPHLMIQARQNPFPTQTAEHLVQPGPATHDGLLFDAQDPALGTKTLETINHMVSDLGQWGLGLTLEDELRRTWHEDMLWWGPAGIGSTYTIPRYAQQHSGVFRAAFKDRSKTKHICRNAEGHYGGFFGWPNFTAIPTGGFMGMGGSEVAAPFRVIDIYRREGDKLKENWIFIDMLHFLKSQGSDVLERQASIHQP